MMDRKISVLVTGVGGRSVGHQVLHALLLLGDKYRIIATDADRFSFGLYQTPHRYVVPPARDPRYLDSLLAVIARESVHVIIPGTQVETSVMVENRTRLETEGRLLITNPADVIRTCENKNTLAQWLIQNGFHTPRTWPSPQWRDAVALSGLPIVGKPASDTGGSKSVAILANEVEVENYLQGLVGTEVLFQEYVGSPEQEFTVGVLVAKDGQVIDSIAMHRTLSGLSLSSRRSLNGRDYALSTGYSQGHIVSHPLIQHTCEDLATRLGARGPLNVQLRLDGDRVVIFEVHPRFSGTSSIRAEAGFNEPDILIRNMLHGEIFSRIAYRREVAAIRAFQHILVPASDVAAVPDAGV